MASKPFYDQGRYEAEITDQGFVKAASSGNTQFVLKFKVLGKIDPADPSKMFPVPAQYERSMYRALTEKTIEYFMEDMAALEVSFGSFTELDPNTEGYIDLVGRTIDMNCSHETNNDGSREKWSIARSFSSKPIESLPANDVKTLDRLFGKHLKKSPAPVQRAAAPVPAGVGITDDDIPF